MMYYYGDYFNFYPYHFFGFLFMVLFWGIIIYGLIHISRGAPNSRNHHDSIDILKERYAKGEITKEQFEEMKKDLRK